MRLRYYNPNDWGHEPPATGWVVENGVASAPSLSGDVSLPVELVSFKAQVTETGVHLQWATESEVDNLGFMVERRVVRANNGPPTDWQQIAGFQTHPALQGQGSTSSRSGYQLLDTSEQEGTLYQYRLADVDVNGMVE